MKFSLSRFLIFAAAALLIPQASAQVVEIPDPNLKRAVREALVLPDEVPITQPEMARLKKLTAKEAQIENIIGLEHATSLRSLVLSVNNIQDITPLEGLKNLNFLILRDNPITDLTPLANLINLNYINLAGIKDVDISALANLTQLRSATLSHMRLRDIAPLGKLVNLIELNLISNQIADISPLANLTALKELHIQNNRVIDVSPLANLTQLTDLTIANNAITDFRPLFGLNLQSVDIDIHKLQELASSKIEIPDPNLERAVREEMGLPSGTSITQLLINQLTKLTANDYQIADLTGLEHATNLKRLSLPDNQIRDITPLASLMKLESLELRDNPITHLTPLANLTNLTYINLAGIRLSDITALGNLTKLKTAWLSHMRLRDITPLANLTQLVRLSLVSNQIVDVSPLASLTTLEELHIERNNIIDISPLQNLSLTTFTYDEVCVLPRSPIQDRIDNRNLPSVILAWDDGILNRGGNWWDDSIPYLDRVAYHDLWWHYTPFGLRFLLTPQGYQLMGSLPSAIARREELLSKNPNMLFLVDLRQSYASRSRYPEDWFGWLRDENGNLIPQKPGSTAYLIDFRLPEVQAVVVQRAIAVSKCGLYDGIMFDAWAETHAVLPNSTLQEEQQALISILQRIRQGVPDDFLILCNRNEAKLPLSAPYINGGFMETFPLERGRLHGYTRKDIIVIETNLIWYETNVREPKINVLRGFGVGAEPPDSPRNKQWMRLFTTMSLTLSDGYSLYTLGTIGGQKQYQKHIRHPFWDADLGQPIGPAAQTYQNIEGLFIREFTNGWAVYNRSGSAQTITLPASATPVSDRGNAAASLTHQLPDLDGEIYLTGKSFADVNGDGKINILDLVQVANGLGESTPDPNGDGVVNILDLVFVAQQFK